MKPRSLPLVLASVCVSCAILPVISKELVFVQAIWRHGDRAPLKLPYPKDPYTESAWQRGWGQLTNIGMQQLNELGRYFRTTYNFFVSNVYIPSEVYIRSSDSDRALTSAQAFTSGFYPANGSLEWQPGGPWQPIPIHGTTPGEPDLLIKPTSTRCKKYDDLVEADDNEQAKRYNTQYSEMFRVLGEGTGIANFSYKNINKIYDINRELIHGMTEKQPSWVFKYWPQYNNRSTMDITYELRTIRRITKFNSTSKANMIAGYLLNNFIENAKKVANGSMTNPKKMLLYSSHDGTLLSLLYALGVANNLTVPYGAAIIMEIYRDDKNFQVEWLYRNDSTKAPYPLKIPECGSPCTVSNMARQYNNIVVDSYAAQQKVCSCRMIREAVNLCTECALS
ncbi:Intestinal acid PHOsphatase [Trichostrongylus colubriformis]|uniref:Intestinal acid PHOsphatase n=1 Tax=Trichostrongylus colubriformis TaxID=6319 RepID=A0AAN8GBT8_TRICO